MRENGIAGYFAKIAPGDRRKEKMLNAIFESKKGDIMPMKQAAKKLSLAAAAVIIISILTVTAAIAIGLGWHEKLIEYLNATDEQIEKLSPAVNMPEATLTQNGVTITVKQTLADRLGVYVLYEITAPETVVFTDDIVFNTYIFDVTANHSETLVGSSVFSAPEVLEQHGNQRTVLQYYSTPDTVVNGSARLILGDLGYYSGFDFVALVEGRWDLEWEFSYVDTSKVFEISTPINVGENVCTITKIIISPMSICIDVEGGSIGNIDPVITFKDGSRITCDPALGFQSWTAGRPVIQIYRRFASLIDMDGVVSVIIGDVTIPIDASVETPSPWATEQVNAAIAAGIVPPELQTHYTQAITRSEFCALAVKLYEMVSGGVITGRETFNDTTDINVQKLAAIGVVNGVGDGNFAPNQSLTREQAATILARLAGAMGKPLSASNADFADSGSISLWALEAVGKIQAANIMNGIGDNTFSPQSPYTREQSIVTLMRLYSY